MTDFTDNAMKFTMDGGIVYDYKEDDEDPDDNVDYKSLAGMPSIFRDLHSSMPPFSLGLL